MKGSAMTIRIFSLPLILLLLLSACSGVTDSNDNDSEYSIYQIEVTYDGGILPCYVSIPDAAYQSSTLTPLLIGLHYGDPNPYSAAYEFMENILLPCFQRLNPFIITPVCPWDQPDGWCGPEAEKGILALLDSVRVWLPVDTNRIAITGYSMGGAGTWHLVEQWPEQFCAAIPMACMPPDSIAEPERYPPFRQIHGTRDQLFAIGEVRSRVIALKQQGLTIELIEGEGRSHYLATTYIPEILKAGEWLEEEWGLNVVNKE